MGVRGGLRKHHDDDDMAVNRKAYSSTEPLRPDAKEVGKGVEVAMDKKYATVEPLTKGLKN